MERKLPKYLFQWTEIDYLETTIEADSLDEAHRIFDMQEFGEPEQCDTEFGDGPIVEEIV